VVLGKPTLQWCPVWALFDHPVLQQQPGQPALQRDLCQAFQREVFQKAAKDENHPHACRTVQK